MVKWQGHTSAGFFVTDGHDYFLKFHSTQSDSGLVLSCSIACSWQPSSLMKCSGKVVPIYSFTARKILRIVVF